MRYTEPMQKYTIFSLSSILILLGLLFLHTPAHAQDITLPIDSEFNDPTAALSTSPAPSTSPDIFYKGRVIQVLSEKTEDNLGIAQASAWTQMVRIEVLDGPSKNKEVELQYGGLSADKKLVEGEKLVLVAPNGVDDPKQFYVFERYRLGSLYLIAGLFVLVTIFFARWKGLTSLLGLGVSVGVLGFYIVPKILAGQNPLVVTIIGSFIIATTALYLAHGFNKRTTVALGSTLITILIAIALSTSFVHLTNLTGIGSEEAFYLQTSPIQGINLKGLLLGGIIIGALGVLDDITTGQAAAVDEIFKANPAMTRRELISRSLSVGREHITSLVNTLALAYAGASFPTLLLFIIYHRPFWVVLNTESISEEVVRTLVGSIALMCAVPITTALAAYFLTGKGRDTSSAEPTHGHSH